jgi:hypothetical protein
MVHSLSPALAPYGDRRHQETPVLPDPPGKQIEIVRVWSYHVSMTSVPDRSRVRLPGISSRAYEHPADRSALVALRKLSGFDL